MKIYKYFLLVMICLHSAIWGDFTSHQRQIFMTPVHTNAVERLRASIFNEEDRKLFAEIGITKYDRWIQEIRKDYFLIHQIEGADLSQSFKMLREKIAQNHPRALALQDIYYETSGIDLVKEKDFPGTVEVTELLSIDVDHENNALIKEYCFIYPLLNKESFLKRFSDKAIYFSETIQDIYRYRGISKTQFWIQESGDHTYMVIYQEITGPVVDARDKYLKSKDDEVASNISKEFCEMTGLSYEELLPRLESLQDSEVLR